VVLLIIDCVLLLNCVDGCELWLIVVWVGSYSFCDLLSIVWHWPLCIVELMCSIVVWLLLLLCEFVLCCWFNCVTWLCVDYCGIDAIVIVLCIVMILLWVVGIPVLYDYCIVECRFDCWYCYYCIIVRGWL